MVEYVDSRASIQLPIDDRLAENMAEAIRKLSRNPQLCKEMANYSVEAAKKFSTKNYYDNFLRIVGEA